MTTPKDSVGVFVLAKNESANIGRSLHALAASGWPVQVLDSGSTDGTDSLVAQHANASLLPYRYVDHCTAYNEITTTLGRSFDVVLVLDADMMVSAQLQKEVLRLIDDGEHAWDALRAPVEMWVEGSPLHRGSLCPPKAFAFKTGAPLFESTGHAEKLLEHVRVHQVSSHLAHDDRKHYLSYLQSQVRYAENLVSRFKDNAVTGRDRLRVRTPLMIALTPLVSYVLKGGFLCGRAGALYALDRLVAEAIMFRLALQRREDDASKK